MVQELITLAKTGIESENLSFFDGKIPGLMQELEKNAMLSMFDFGEVTMTKYMKTFTI